MLSPIEEQIAINILIFVGISFVTFCQIWLVLQLYVMLIFLKMKLLE